MNFIKWLLKSVGPYIVGILIGIGFAYLLVDLLSNPLSLPGQAVQSVKDSVAKVIPADKPAPVSKPAPAVEAPKAAAPAPKAPVKAEEPPPPPPPVKVAEAAPPPPPPAPEPAPAPAPAIEPAPVAEPPQATMAEPAPAAEEPAPAPMQQQTPWNHAQAPYGQPQQPPMAQPPAEVVAKCGQPPRTPGYAMSRYYACLWQQQCEARQARALEMIRRSKEACPKSGANAQLCQNYYASLEQQYQSGMCPQQWNQNAPAGQPPQAPAPAPQPEQPAAAPQGM